MTFLHHHSHVHRRVAEGTSSPTLGAGAPGVTVEFLTLPEDVGNAFSIMRGVVPAGVVVPLHSHDEAEAFFIVDGTQQVLIQGPDGLEWNDFHAGDYVNVPPGTPHAHRNVSDRPAVDLIITTARMGRFFLEVGKPEADRPAPRTPDDVAQFIATAVRYGYSLGTPEENAAVGIELPGVPPGRQ
ncbi:MAG: cupin domain-containing protein [Acidimicrobiaceae bacterium]|nr:cupin domain-containing protein [Acidimicrobiaceae bacterium]